MYIELFRFFEILSSVAGSSYLVSLVSFDFYSALFLFTCNINTNLFPAILLLLDFYLAFTIRNWTN